MELPDELDIRLAAKKEPEPEEGSLTVDVFKEDGEIVIQSTIAGTTAQDLDISILNDMVTIKGSRKPDTDVQSKDYFYQELYWGAFSRTIILPEEVDADSARASMKNGILTIRLPTIQKAKTKKVMVELK
ncbi:MAG TPA: Hsp20/alpha crystallin family protein [Candidatus Paceibacterota bacterium]|nr:Hsp20/alpha crystallin family protein [Candidatus Paceibacterota bacterium]